MVAVLGIIFALPNLIGGDDGAGADFLPGKQINLGLDLQGGSHLLLRVDVDAVKQIFPKLLLGDQLLQTAIGRRYDTDIDLLGVAAAQRVELFVFQDP